jgi:alpha-beta hydrolase superfamily lysophospholipase
LLGLVLALVLSRSGGEASRDAPPSGNYTEARFSSTDGVALHGRLFGAGPVAVVLAHMYPADQRSWQPFAETLAAEGYTALTFDFRGYGNSAGKKEIAKIDQDVEGAVQYLRGRGARGIFLIGASMGGTATLKVASRQRFLGVAALSAPTEFQGLEALSQMGKLQTPVLLIAAENDKAANKAAADLFKAAPRNRLLEIYQGGDHGTDLLSGKYGSFVKDRLLGFLGAYGG